MERQTITPEEYDIHIEYALGNDIAEEIGVLKREPNLGLVRMCEEILTLRTDYADLKRLAEAMDEAMQRLIDAGENYAADQRYATDKRCGLVQPITVEEGVELNESIEAAMRSLDAYRARFPKEVNS